MSADESVIGGLAGRYAVALFELAQELPADDQSQLADNMAALKVLIAGSDDLQKLLKRLAKSLGKPQEVLNQKLSPKISLKKPVKI